MEKFLNYILLHGRVAITAKAILDKLTEIVKNENEELTNDLYKLTNEQLDKLLDNLETSLKDSKKQKELH